MKLYANHPLAEIFPKLAPDEVRQLVQSVKENGLQKAITIYEGKILDGRHRYEACSMADVRPVFEFYKGTDPLGYVIVANLHRRHLDTAQRAMIAAKLATMEQGGDRRSGKFQTANLRFDQTTAAETLGVSPRSVTTATKILDVAPKLAEKVVNGEISLNAAEQKIKQKRITKLDQPIKDKEGWTVPPEVLAIWNRAQEAQDLMTAISRSKCVLVKAQEDKDLFFSGRSFQRALTSLEAAYEAASQFLPYAVCVSCNGRLSSQCTLCQGRGVISEDLWKTPKAQEIAAIRAKQVKL